MSDHHLDDLLAPDGTYNPCTVRGLGRTQKVVLHILANHRELSARDLAYHWPTITQSSAGMAVLSLARRGLVDMAGFDGRSRTYCITDKGLLVERALDADLNEDA